MNKYLIFGAHPDDPDLMFGGCAIKLARAGHAVKFVSCTDGGAGHYNMERTALVERRHREAGASAAVAGIAGAWILGGIHQEMVGDDAELAAFRSSAVATFPMCRVGGRSSSRARTRSPRAKASAAWAAASTTRARCRPTGSAGSWRSARSVEATTTRATPDMVRAWRP